MFLLDRPYQYPPDQVSVEILEQWTVVDKEITYDPIPYNPDVLVIGPFARGTGIYDDVLPGDQFDLLEQLGTYGIYQRTR